MTFALGLGIGFLAGLVVATAWAIIIYMRLR